MDAFFREATSQNSLHRAWRHIKSNGRASRCHQTRDAIDQFDHTPEQNIRTLQKQLRDNATPFQFDPQHGVLKAKSSGGKRGIVMASVRNRVVERALLDTLQNKSSFIQNIIAEPTSIGGVPDRSVPHGLAAIRAAFSDGRSYFVRSDISGFFDNIPRGDVLRRIGDHVPDLRFMELLTNATSVVLANELTLGEDRKSFPEGEEGVAQGSPLSPLFGNVLLNDFDRQFNRDGIVCIRFIDDFLLLAPNMNKAQRAYQAAREHLQALGLSCHDPFCGMKRPDKAEAGEVEKGFVFLGYDIRPGLFQPSAKARSSILAKIDDHFRWGRKAICKIKGSQNSFAAKQRYAQTLDIVDRALRGWGDAFSYANGIDAIEGVDRAVDVKLAHFRSWYGSQIKNADWKVKRRTGGVCLASDVARKSLDELPYRLEKGQTFSNSKSAILISTDGSLVGCEAAIRSDVGAGGWAFVNHETDTEHGGWEHDTTNNRMELRAVVEALKSIEDKRRPIQIRTDSQYVFLAATGKSVVRKNADLWEQYNALVKGRKVKVVWVKGHNQDPHNERADRLASLQANLARNVRELRRKQPAQVVPDVDAIGLKLKANARDA